MTPPQKLRAELERLRQRGYRFKQAWPVAVSTALQDEHVEVAYFWRGTWREQETVWEVSYSRLPWPANQRPGLEPTDVDASSFAPRTSGTPVAA